MVCAERTIRRCGRTTPFLELWRPGSSRLRPASIRSSLRPFAEHFKDARINARQKQGAVKDIKKVGGGGADDLSDVHSNQGSIREIQRPLIFSLN